MNGAFSPIAIAQAIIRNIVPVVGILAFHWSAGNVLILYLLDTLLSMAVIIAGLASSFAPPSDDGVASLINAEAGYVLSGLLVAGFLAVPLGMPVGIALAASSFSFLAAFHDHSLRVGALVQAVVALWSYIGLYRALKTHSPEQLRLRMRFALVLMRWIVLLMATYFLLDILPPSDVLLLLLVLAYAAGSIAAEVAPDRFLRAMPGGESNLQEGPVPSTSSNPRAQRDKHRHDTR